jgi:Mg/Co/Ni transporter MgtE
LLPNASTVQILRILEPEQAASLLRFLPTAEIEAILRCLDAQFAAELRQLLSYPEQSAGAYMTSRVIVLSDDLSVADALEVVRSSAGLLLTNLYVLTRSGSLAGVLGLDRLFRESPETAISEITTTEVATLNVSSGINAILSHPAWHDYHALPVVDGSNHFAGVIRYKTLQQLQRTRPSSANSIGAKSTTLDLAQFYCTGLNEASRIVGSLLGTVAPQAKKDT